MHRHRRREQENLRLRGQHALARDIERWVSERRNRLLVVEGLNESGEAPPPYKPKDDTNMTLTAVDGGFEPAVDVTVPPRTLSRDEAQHARLPDYMETIRPNDNITSTENTTPTSEAPTDRVARNAS